jgi:DNA-binding GntR family transcriptional regulator
MAERVAASLRKAILSGELAPGEYIRQEKWAAALNVSRVPVREALKVLTSEGLLGHHPNKGYYLIKLDMEEMAQIYLMRRLLEPELIRTLRWPAARQLASLRETASKAEQALAGHDPVACLDLERTIDFQIYELSRLRIVVREVKRLWELAGPYRYLVFAEPAQFHYGNAHALRQRHRRLFDALEAQDRGALERAFLLNFDTMLGYFCRPPFVTDGVAQDGADPIQTGSNR